MAEKFAGEDIAKRCAGALFDALSEGMKRRLSRDELNDIAAMGMRDIEAVRKANPTIGVDEARAKILDKSKERVLGQIQNKVNKATSMLKERERWADVNRRMKTGNLTAEQAMLSMDRGIEYSADSSLVSDEARILIKKYSDWMLYMQSFEDGLYGRTKTGAFDLEIRKERFGEQTGHGDAKSVANIIKTFSQKYIEEANDLGLSMRERKNWIPRTFDSVEVLTRKEEFKQLINQHLDWKILIDDVDSKTPEDLVEIKNKALENIWRDRSIGSEFETKEGNINLYSERKLGDRLMKHRELVFTSADGEHEVMTKFGRGTILDAMQYQIQKNARDLAMLSANGANAEDTRINIAERLANKAREEGDIASHDALKRFVDGDQTSPFSKNSDYMFGKVSAPEIPWSVRFEKNQVVSKALSAIKSISPAAEKAIRRLGIKSLIRGGILLQRTSKLPSGAVAMFNDPALMMFQATHNGRTALSVTNGIMNEIFHATRNDPVWQKELYSKILVFSEQMVGEMHRDSYANDAIGGLSGKVQDLTYKLGGWQQVGNLLRYSNGLENSLSLAEHLPNGVEDAKYRNTLLKYGVNDIDLKYLKTLSMKEISGENYSAKVFSPDLIQNMSDESVIGIMKEKGMLPGHPLSESRLKSMADNYRNELQMKFTQLFVGENKNAIHSPSWKTAGFKSAPFGQVSFRKGSTAEALNAAFWQFKDWSLWATMHPLARMAHGMPGGKMDVGGLGIVLPAATILGYVTLAAKNGLMGKEPPSLTDYKTWEDSAVYGGATGFYGDIAMARYNDSNGGIAEKLGGPLYGEIYSASKKTFGPLRGGAFWTLPDVEKMALNNAPGINLPLFRIGFNMMLRYRLDEYLNPGHGARLEKFAQENGSPYFSWARPTQYLGK